MTDKKFESFTIEDLGCDEYKVCSSDVNSSGEDAIEFAISKTKKDEPGATYFKVVDGPYTDRGVTHLKSWKIQVEYLSDGPFNGSDRLVKDLEKDLKITKICLEQVSEAHALAVERVRELEKELGEEKRKGFKYLTDDMKKNLRTRLKDKLFDKENGFPMYRVSHPSLLMDVLVDQFDRYLKIMSGSGEFSNQEGIEKNGE